MAPTWVLLKGIVDKYLPISRFRVDEQKYPFLSSLYQKTFREQQGTIVIFADECMQVALQLGMYILVYISI